MALVWRLKSVPCLIALVLMATFDSSGDSESQVGAESQVGVSSLR